MDSKDKQLIAETLRGAVERAISFQSRFPPENSFDQAMMKLDLERAVFIDSMISAENFSAFTVERDNGEAQIWVLYPADNQQTLLASTLDACDIEGY